MEVGFSKKIIQVSACPHRTHSMLTAQSRDTAWPRCQIAPKRDPGIAPNNAPPCTCCLTGHGGTRARSVAPWAECEGARSADSFIAPLL